MENRRDMDFAEKADFRTAVDISVALGQRAMVTRERLRRLLDSPYFGRVDFYARGDVGTRPYYIGVHNFMVPETQEILIHDWRAPVSGLYYDFETGGAAFFDAPAGAVEGEITGKRQYKIQRGHLEYMFDSSLNIGDDVLQRELGRSTDTKMKNIVATIQREQNAVIRNETAQVLILQGGGGLGKDLDRPAPGGVSALPVQRQHLVGQRHDPVAEQSVRRLHRQRAARVG